MSVRVKALLLLAASVVGLVGAVWLLLGQVITARFARLEADGVRRDVERLLQAVDREAAGLEVTATDWAEWDESFEYLTTGSEKFQRVNLTADTLQDPGPLLAGVSRGRGAAPFRVAALEHPARCRAAVGLRTWR